MRLPLSFHELKHFFSKASSNIKPPKQTQRHYMFAKKPKTTSSSSPYYFQRRSTDPAAREHHRTYPIKGVDASVPFYQLEELKIAETTSQWEMATLQEMMTMTTDTTRPIKTKLEALALQRQFQKSCHRREMADEAYMETLYIQQQPHPVPWPFTA